MGAKEQLGATNAVSSAPVLEKVLTTVRKTASKTAPTSCSLGRNRAKLLEPLLPRILFVTLNL